MATDELQEPFRTCCSVYDWATAYLEQIQSQSRSQKTRNRTTKHWKLLTRFGKRKRLIFPSWKICCQRCWLISWLKCIEKRREKRRANSRFVERMIRFARDNSKKQIPRRNAS